MDILRASGHKHNSGQQLEPEAELYLQTSPGQEETEDKKVNKFKHGILQWVQYNMPSWLNLKCITPEQEQHQPDGMQLLENKDAVYVNVPGCYLDKVL